MSISTKAKLDLAIAEHLRDLRPDDKLSCWALTMAVETAPDLHPIDGKPTESNRIIYIAEEG